MLAKFECLLQLGWLQVLFKSLTETSSGFQRNEGLTYLSFGPRQVISCCVKGLSDVTMSAEFKVVVLGDGAVGKVAVVMPPPVVSGFAVTVD